MTSRCDVRIESTDGIISSSFVQLSPQEPIKLTTNNNGKCGPRRGNFKSIPSPIFEERLHSSLCTVSDSSFFFRKGGIKDKTKMSVRPRHKERVRFPSNKQVPADAALHPLAARLF